ncbi:MAG: formylglycine-generating enzyme family protein, partial [Gammaproteobacteria bacterium]|nr:formylglycine-generating enzyme family protein [Gammaproteobacteria bacterium]
AEWEYAARAGSTTEYSWGNDIGSNRANCDNDYCGDSWDYTAPVGSFPANPWGLHDMHGNVWEWAQDCWNDSYEGAPTDGSAWTSGNCGRRVVRGGAWNFFARYLRSAYRIWDARTLRNGDNGFRLAQDE